MVYILPIQENWASYREKLATKKAYQEKFTAPEARVLVVDDNQMNLVVFENLVQKTKVAVETGNSGIEGIRLSRSKKYDMIFLDHMMPGKDRMQTLREIRQDSLNPNLTTPFICLTANAIAGAKEKYLKAGFDDYLAKPINPNQLEEMMLTYFPADKVVMNGQ